MNCEGWVNGQVDSNPSDYSATVNWGDGSGQQTAQIAPSGTGGGELLVEGSHDYSQRGVFKVSVTINAPGQSQTDSQATDVTVQQMPDPASLPASAPTTYPGDQPLGSNRVLGRVFTCSGHPGPKVRGCG